MIIGFPFTKGGNVFCGKEWKYNDMNAGFIGLAAIGVPDVHGTFGTSPNFFGGNCDKIGWNAETGFGLVIGGSPVGEAVYGVYLLREKLTPRGEELLLMHYGADALGVEEPKPEPTAEALAEAKKEAQEMGIPARFINGASEAEIRERIEQVNRGEDLGSIIGKAVENAPIVAKPYDAKASAAKGRPKK